MPHDELDQLSAYIDGELDDAARARLDAHLPSCAECSATLDGLRATLADLKTLPDEAPSEQDSWAIRGAIMRARKPVHRWQRFGFAAGTAAAALVAIVAVTHQSPSSSSATAFQAQPVSPGVPVFSVGQNFDQFSAQTLLLEVSGKVPAGKVLTAPASRANATAAYPQLAAGGAGSASEGGPSQDATQVAPQAVPSAELNRCVDVVRRSQQEFLDPMRYELATFDGTASFFLFFRASDRVQLWVVSRDPKHSCDLLFFAQTH